jgi:acyl carrier protein
MGTEGHAPSATLAVMRDILVKRFGVDPSNVTLDQRLDTLGLDSLAFIEYTFDIEKRLSLELPDVPRDLVTVGDFAAFLERHIVEQSAAG